MEEKIFLQRVVKHTNIDQTRLRVTKNSYISATTFPSQMEELINKEITIKYRNYFDYTDPVTVEKAATRKKGDSVVSTRPKDDIQRPEYTPITPEERRFDYRYVLSKKVIILRADSEYPFIFIGISPDYMELVNGYTQLTDKNGVVYNLEDYITIEDDEVIVTPDSIFDKKVYIYPLQQMEYIGASCTTEYPDGAVDSRVIRVDSTEPSMTILMELIDTVDEYGIPYMRTPRYVLGDEINAEFLSKIEPRSGDIYDFGDLDDPDTETAYGDYDFGDLDEGTDPDTVATTDYDFNILAYASDRADIASNLDIANYRKILIEEYGETIHPVAEDVYDFGDLDDPDTETATGDYDFGDLTEGVDPDTVANSNYDFDVLAHA